MSEYSNPKASDKNDRSEIGGQHGQTVHCLALLCSACAEQCRKPSSNSERSEKNLAESKSTCSTGTSIVCPQFTELRRADSTGCRFLQKHFIYIMRFVFYCVLHKKMQKQQQSEDCFNIRTQTLKYHVVF